VSEVDDFQVQAWKQSSGNWESWKLHGATGVVAAAWRQLDIVRKCHMSVMGHNIGMSSEVRGEWEGKLE